PRRQAEHDARLCSVRPAADRTAPGAPEGRDADPVHRRLDRGIPARSQGDVRRGAFVRRTGRAGRVAVTSRLRRAGPASGGTFYCIVRIAGRPDPSPPPPHLRGDRAPTAVKKSRDAARLLCAFSHGEKERATAEAFWGRSLAFA